MFYIKNKRGLVKIKLVVGFLSRGMWQKQNLKCDKNKFVSLEIQNRKKVDCSVVPSSDKTEHYPGILGVCLVGSPIIAIIQYSDFVN